MPATKQTQGPIRVALSNDYELALLGLAQMLAQHPDRVKIVDITTSPDLLHEADIVLFDTFGRLPGNDVKLRKIVDQNSAKVVVYSWEDYPEEAALGGGAVAYLHKGISAGELVSALEAINEGVNIPKVKPSGGASNVTWPGKDLGLSSREAEILTYITRGLSNEDITERANVTINTVKSYIRNAYRKIDVRTRAQAVAWGYQHGFQSTDDTGF
jgi:NarL family two-component system response regulator LiaR